jgi:hypothetical protein
MTRAVSAVSSIVGTLSMHMWQPHFSGQSLITHSCEPDRSFGRYLNADSFHRRRRLKHAALQQLPSHTDWTSLAPIDDRGYPFGFGAPHEAWPR